MSQNQEPETPETSHEGMGQGAGTWDELGTPKTKLDERGRLKMPAEFKAFIERKYGKGFNAFYITSRDGKSAEIYPLPEWLEWHKKVVALPPSNEARNRLLAGTSSTATGRTWIRRAGCRFRRSCGIRRICRAT